MPTHSNIKKSYIWCCWAWCDVWKMYQHLNSNYGQCPIKTKITCRKSSRHTRCWVGKSKWLFFEHILSF